MKIKTQDPKSMQPSKSSSKKEFYSNTNLPKEKKKPGRTSKLFQ